MAKFTIGIVGLGQTIKKFNNIGNMNLSKPLRFATNKVQRLAKEYSPKDTGTLRGSILTKPINRIDYKDGGFVYTNTEYAVYQEFGTVHMPPANHGRGYLRASLLELDSELKSDIEKYIKDTLGSYKK